MCLQPEGGEWGMDGRPWRFSVQNRDQTCLIGQLVAIKLPHDNGS